MAKDQGVNLNIKGAERFFELSKEFGRFHTNLKSSVETWRNVNKEVAKTVELSKQLAEAARIRPAQASAQAYRRPSSQQSDELANQIRRARADMGTRARAMSDADARFSNLGYPPRPRRSQQPPQRPPEPAELRQQMPRPPEGAKVVQHPVTKQFMSIAKAEREGFIPPSIQDVMRSSRQGPQKPFDNREHNRRMREFQQSEFHQRVEREREHSQKWREAFPQKEEWTKPEARELWRKPRVQEKPGRPRTQEQDHYDNVSRLMKDMESIFKGWMTPSGWIGALERIFKVFKPGAGGGAANIFSMMTQSPAMMLAATGGMLALGAVGKTLYSAGENSEERRKAMEVGVDPLSKLIAKAAVGSRLGQENMELILGGMGEAKRDMYAPSATALRKMYGEKVTEQKLADPRNFGVVSAQYMTDIRNKLLGLPAPLQMAIGRNYNAQEFMGGKGPLQNILNMSNKEFKEFTDKLIKSKPSDKEIASYTADLQAQQNLKQSMDELTAEIHKLNVGMQGKLAPYIEAGVKETTNIFKGKATPEFYGEGAPITEEQIIKGINEKSQGPAPGQSYLNYWIHGRQDPNQPTGGEPKQATATPGPTVAAFSMSMASDPSAKGTSQWMKQWFMHESQASKAAAGFAEQRDQKLTDLMSDIRKREDKSDKVDRDLLDLINILKGKDKKGEGGKSLAEKNLEGAAEAGYGPLAGKLAKEKAEGRAITVPEVSNLGQAIAAGGPSVPAGAGPLMKEIAKGGGGPTDVRVGTEGPGGSGAGTKMGEYSEAQRGKLLDAMQKHEGYFPGSRSFRNNNPGNIEYGPFAKAHGATGSDGRFAIFPDYQSGRSAQEKLLFESPSYKNLNLGQAIKRWAPASENDVPAYLKAMGAADGGGVPVANKSSMAPVDKSVTAPAAADGSGAALIKGTQRGATGSDQSKAVDDLQKMMGVNDCEGRDKLKQYLGGSTLGMDPHDEPWCAMTVNAALAHVGIKGTGSAGAASFAKWGTAVDPSAISKGDVAEYKSGAHVGFLTGAKEMRGGEEYVQMLAGNECLAKRSDPTRDKTQIGQVGTHWMKASELNIRRAAGQAGGVSGEALGSGPTATETTPGSGSSTMPASASAPSSTAVSNACGCGGDGGGGGGMGGNPLAMLGGMLGGRGGAAMGGMLGQLLGGGGPLSTNNWQAPDRKHQFNVASSIGADISVALSQIAM